MTQEQALTILKTGANVFLTGEPGSGKTHTINAYIDWLRACGIEPSVTAATGIAATHVGGMTLHSWSGIGIADRLSNADIDHIASKEHIARRIQKAKVLIIEEVSMLSAATLEAAEAVVREVRRNERPFGGIPVVFVGDFFQLPPVSKGERTAQFAYDSNVWKDLNPLVCYLTDQHRQDDTEYLEVLSAVRRNDVEEMHYERLMSRKVKESETPATSKVPKLYSHNADVDRINAAELAKIDKPLKKFKMSSMGKDSMVEGLKRGCLSPEVLELKEGAVVMCTKNSPQGRFVNGTLGTVVAFAASGVPIIETTEGERIEMEPMGWQLEEQGKVRASITQIPLRLAYAMTVHKSQGMSMDAAVIDLSQAFEYGQGYVALSRVRRLEGLYLLGLNARALQVHPEILERDYALREASIAAVETFDTLPKEEVEQLQKQFVKALGGAWTTQVESKEVGKTRAKGLVGRLAQTLQAVRDARTLREAATARGLSVSTVVKHLEELQASGGLAPADYAHILHKDKAVIAEAIQSKEERLTPIFNRLRGRYSFEDIRLVRLAQH